MKKQRNMKNGITLISIVITIVILLILSGIGVSIIIGNDGMIGKTKDIAGNYEISIIKEQIQRDILSAERKKELKEEDIENILQNYGTVTRDVEGTVKGLNPTKYPTQEILLSEIWNGVTVEDPSIYTDSVGKKAKIPEGFTVSTTPGETEIDDGLVVTAPDGSEFVWVPVANPVLDVQGMNDTQINAAIQAEVTAERYPMAIKVDSTNYKGVLYDFIGTIMPATIIPKSYASSGTSYREPDILTDYDNTTSNYTGAGIIGITTSAQFKTQLQNEYNAMVESVIANGGFFIGRYETSTRTGNVIQSKANVAPLASINWYKMYARQKAYTSDNSITSVKSSMIWGSSWDQVQVWMKDVQNPYLSNKSYVLDAAGMANYSGTTGLDIWPSTTTPAPTGCIAVKNIYDMAGNADDWTIEAISSYGRVGRGSDYNDAVGWRAADDRSHNGADVSTSVSIGSRAQLYL